MPGMPPPAAGEREILLEFLRFNQNAFFAVAYGLTDAQARACDAWLLEAGCVPSARRNAWPLQLLYRQWLTRMPAPPGRLETATGLRAAGVSAWIPEDASAHFGQPN